jgi:hypothetical protein
MLLIYLLTYISKPGDEDTCIGQDPVVFCIHDIQAFNGIFRDFDIFQAIGRCKYVFFYTG